VRGATSVGLGKLRGKIEGKKGEILIREGGGEGERAPRLATGTGGKRNRGGWKKNHEKKLAAARGVSGGRRFLKYAKGEP